MDSRTLVLRAGSPDAHEVQQCLLQIAGVSSEIRIFLAAEIFGTSAGWLLYGFLAAQIYTYSTRSSSKDHPLFKALVYGAVLVVTIETALETFINSILMQSNWGVVLDDDPFSAVDIMSDLQPIFSAIPGILVQGFFTWRIWTFSMAFYRRTAVRYLFAAICVLIVIMGLCAFASALALVRFLMLADPDDTAIAIAILAWTVPSAIADVTITVCMITILNHAKSSACFGETHHILSRLLRLTIQTGFVTSLLVVPVAPLFFHDTSDWSIYNLLWFLVGKFYVISLLANLNARSYRPSGIHADSKGNEGDDGRTTSPSHIFTTQLDSHSEAISGNGTGIFSLVRSLAYTIHRDLTTVPPEDSVHGDGSDTQSGDVKGHSGLMHTGAAEREEIFSID